MKIIDNGIVTDEESFCPMLSLTIHLPVEPLQDLHSANRLDIEKELGNVIGEAIVFFMKNRKKA